MHDYCYTVAVAAACDRVVRQTGALFTDGRHILYVNGEYRSDDPIGRLMHDFACTDYRDIFDEYIKNGVRMLKESETGKGKIMEASEMLIDFGRKQERENTAKEMLADQKPLQEILKYSRITLSALKKLCAQMGVPVPT